MEWSSKDKTTEKDIIIQVVQDLSKISQSEFKGGYENNIFQGNNIVKVYVEDSRKKYCQLVEFLSDMLLPYFNEKMKEAYKDIIPKLDEIIEKFNKGELGDEEFMITKLRLCRRMLQNLFILLKEINWTKAQKSIG